MTSPHELFSLRMDEILVSGARGSIPSNYYSSRVDLMKVTAVRNLLCQQFGTVSAMKLRQDPYGNELAVWSDV